VHRKVHLFGAERAWWVPGDGAGALIPVNDVSIGMLVCYDGEFPEMPRILRLAGADVIAVPTTNMTPYERDQELIFATRGLENECVVAVCNRVGSERGWSYFGRSAVFDARGNVVQRAGSTDELLIVDVDVSGAGGDPQLSYLNRRRPDAYRSLVEPRRVPSPRLPATSQPWWMEGKGSEIDAFVGGARGVFGRAARTVLGLGRIREVARG
jgi:predicted amidohydrolase